jgi:transposase
MVRESLEPGQSVSVVARRNGINANQLFCGASFIRTAACRRSVLVKPTHLRQRQSETQNRFEI